MTKIMQNLLKKVVTALILASFLAAAFLGFAMMTYGSDGSMSDDCLFSPIGLSLCPQNTLAVVTHHVSAYYAFLNVPVGVSLTVLMISLLFVAYAALAVFTKMLLDSPPALAWSYHDDPPVDRGSGKRARWLSLFENSPSN